MDFNGRVERLGIGAILNNASIGFENHVKDRCGADTLIDYDNDDRYPEEDNPGIPRTREDYIAETPAAELECRAAAVADWIAREQGLAGATIVRAPTGLLLEVNDGWVNQGEQTTRTLIFNSTFSFDSSDLPFVDDDFGGFSLNFSATKMLELSIERYAAGERAYLCRCPCGWCWHAQYRLLRRLRRGRVPRTTVAAYARIPRQHGLEVVPGAA